MCDRLHDCPAHNKPSINSTYIAAMVIKGEVIDSAGLLTDHLVSTPRLPIKVRRWLRTCTGAQGISAGVLGGSRTEEAHWRTFSLHCPASTSKSKQAPGQLPSTKCSLKATRYTLIFPKHRHPQTNLFPVRLSFTCQP